MTIYKSQQESSQDIVNNYAAVVDGAVADTAPGTVNLDLIDPVGSQVSSAYSSIESVRELTSLKNASLVTTDGLSPVGLNFDLCALGATSATGTVFFQKILAPTKIIDFPVGTIVQTMPDTTGTSILFVTTSDAQLSPSTTFNPVNRRYESSASVVARVPGSGGNVGPGSISLLATPNRNIDTVVNKIGLTGGTDEEDPSSFSTRILAKTSTVNIGTETGYQEAILSEFPTVTQVAIAGPGNPAMVRNEFGNEVDVYLLGTGIATFTDTISVSGASSDLLKTHPVDSLTSVTGITNGQVYGVGTDVVLTKDVGPVFGGSTKAFDYVTWQTANRPSAAQKVIVSGVYNSLVVSVQNYLSSDDARFVTEDILAKEATRIGIVVVAQVTALSGYDRTTLASTIQAAVTTGVAGFPLGKSVHQSDIVDLIGNVPGVDEVGIPLLEMRMSSEPAGTVDDSITVNNSSYAQIDSALIYVS